MKIRGFFAFSLFLLGSSSAIAINDAQQQAIESLGQLNGIALQCTRTPEMQSMKQAMVDNLPKQRSLGEVYDNATNASFINFAKNNKACPDHKGFTIKVNTAIDNLKQAFSHH